jgi:hypothetical protein
LMSWFYPHWSPYLPSWTINSLLFWSNFLCECASSQLQQNSRNSLSTHWARWSWRLGSRSVACVIQLKDLEAYFISEKIRCILPSFFII